MSSHCATRRAATARSTSWRRAFRRSAAAARVVLNSRDVTERLHATEALRERDKQLRQAQKMEAVGPPGGRHRARLQQRADRRSPARANGCRTKSARCPAPRTDIETILRNSDRAASLTRQLLAFSRQQTLAPQPLDLGALVRKATHLLKRLIGEHIELAHRSPAAGLCGRGRSDADRAGADEPGHQRARRDGRRRVAAHHRPHGVGGRAVRDQPSADDGGRVRAARGHGHRYRHDAGNAGARVRTVLHDEGSRAWDRARPVDRLRDRQAERWLHLD